MKRLVLLGFFAATLPITLYAQGDSRLQAVLEAEDRRGQGPAGITPLLEAIDGSDTLLVRVAVRGIGRLQRPDLASRLVRFLDSSSPAIRAEASIAIAQALRGASRDAAPRTGDLHASTALEPMLTALRQEPDDSVAGVMAEAIGRLQLTDSTHRRAAARAIVERGRDRLGYGMVHGLYWLALGGTGFDSVTTGALAAALGDPAPETRRLAVVTLSRLQRLSEPMVLAALADPDPQVRRLALQNLRALPLERQDSVTTRAMRDTAAMVRIGALRAVRARPAPVDCTLILEATADPHPHVRLAAITALGAPCRERAPVAQRLAELVDGRAAEAARWQVPAYALVSLARVDSAAARARVERFAGSTRWEERLHAARAARHLADSALLATLARDRDHNVQEAAIAGLAAVAGRSGDPVYLAALESKGHQVLLAAGEALKGTTHSDALPRILDVFDRLSATRSETARDPRLSLLGRIGELGSAAAAGRLRPYLADYDTAVAKGTAELLTRWTGEAVEPRPVPLEIGREPLAKLFQGPAPLLRITLAPEHGGGSFVIALNPRVAPATVARIVRRAREGYYDGLVFQRVEPNFVVQGGGPDASEYVGDDRFMRDEVAFVPHFRGTVGISTRGRDTGDAQVFINLVDNPSLDHEYTVFGRVVRGMEVVDRMVEGDRIARVTVEFPR